MTREIKHIPCRNCGESFHPNSRKNTHYCNPRCGDDFRNRRKSDIRQGKIKNSNILNSYNLTRGTRKSITQEELEGKGFKVELFDAIEYLPIADSATKSSIVYYGHYIINNEHGKLYLTKF